MDVVGDRYELGRPLGAGGMARVVEAHDRVLDRKVAVKLLRDDIAMDASVRGRFLQEARTAARFNHHNAVAVYDTGQDGRQPWIVMELIHGGDLAQHLAQHGALPQDEAVRIADGVLAALAAAHRDGMVHRDVKPGNIMLLDDGGVKLADFGIAKSVQDATAGLTATGQVIGTAKYLSPEQVDGKPATPSSDVYATGVVLYEMLTGEPPFTGDSAIAVALAHTRKPVPDLRRKAPGVSPQVASVVERSLAKDPADRYADADEMRRALGGEAIPAAFAPTAVVHDQPARTRVLPRERPRRRVPWVLIALTLLALLTAAVLAALANSAGDPAAGPTDPAAQDDAPQGEQQQQQEEEPAAEEPPAEESAATEVPPEPEVIAPTDLASLIQRLEANPGAYGTKQPNLQQELRKVVDQEGRQQAETAEKVQEEIAKWVEKGELDADIGAVAITLLDPIAAEAGGPPDHAGGGEGEGRGNGNGDD